MESINCTQCGESTAVGFVLETGHGNGRSATIWVEGMPEKSFWDFGIKLDGKEKFPITAYRCTKCGHLEFYAQK